jgi:hypothetical protein
VPLCLSGKVFAFASPRLRVQISLTSTLAGIDAPQHNGHPITAKLPNLLNIFYRVPLYSLSRLIGKPGVKKQSITNSSFPPILHQKQPRTSQTLPKSPVHYKTIDNQYITIFNPKTHPKNPSKTTHILFLSTHI